MVLPLIGCGASNDKDTTTSATTGATTHINAGVVTTLAGSIAAGSADGTGTAAAFRGPRGVAVDPSGNVYVVDSGNNMIRKITPAGVVTAFAGSTAAGSGDGTGNAASFSNPYGIAIDSTGNVYVTDYGNYNIRKITPTGVVTTLAGSTARGSTNGTGTGASFSSSLGVAVDSNGNVYVADTFNHMIRKITAQGVVTTVAGSTTSGSADATGTAARFNRPSGIAVDTIGNFYVADSFNNMIRKMDAGGVVTTVAGSTTRGSLDGTGTAASFNQPLGIAVNTNNNFYYVGDYNNNLIRKIA
jgi:serine/threonine protein kinase, bacterial